MTIPNMMHQQYCMGVNIDIFVKGHTRDIRYCFAHNFLILVGFEWESLGLCSLSAKVPISLI